MNNTLPLTVDQFWLREAYKTALHSPDLSTQNGAILINRRAEMISYGCNVAPHGVEHRLERPDKYDFTEHAERKAIYAAAKTGYNTREATLYALWAACSDCGRGIIEAGIRRVVTHSFYATYSNPDASDRKDWAGTIGNAAIMFEEAGVELVFCDLPIMMHGETGLRFNGEVVYY